VLGIGREEVDSLLLKQLVFLDTVCVDKLLFQGGIMYLCVEHIWYRPIITHTAPNTVRH
jgi:hypothetical protein